MSDRPERIRNGLSDLANRLFGGARSPQDRKSRDSREHGEWSGLLSGSEDRLFSPGRLRGRRKDPRPDRYPPFTPGVPGDYRISFDQELGAGGIAVVYPGQDLRDGRPVAIKMLKDEYRADPAHRARLQRERSMMRDNRHPVLLKAYQYIEPVDTARSPWIVMELAEGHSLKHVVANGGPVAPREVGRILIGVLAGLEELHDRGIVHLDIKPQHILRSDTGSLKLVDFGLAQEAGRKQALIGEHMFGTAAYISPEQATGQVVDGRSDLYSLGCVAYELLTGRAPFTAPDGPGQQDRLISQHLHDHATSPAALRPGIPPALSDAIMTVLAKRPDDRYPSAVQFAQAISLAVGGNASGADPTQPLKPAEAAVPRGPSPIARAAGALARGSTRFAAASARRLNPIRGSIVRPVALALLLMLLIAGWQGPESLVDRGLAAGPALTAEVTTHELHLRQEPTLTATILVMLPLGSEIRIVGLSELHDELTWWEVKWETDSRTYHGWIWEGGLAEGGWPDRLGIVQAPVDWMERQRERATDALDRVAGWWPLA